MSEENKNNAGGETQEPVVPEKKELSPLEKAYQDVTKDMHKFKARAKEADERAKVLEAQMKAQEEAKMQEEQRWKELYEKREAELEQANLDKHRIVQQHTNSVKRAALKNEIGSNVRDEYLNFANLDSIVVNEDGSIDKESVRQAANYFRKEHGQLIPPSENTNITGQAATSQAPNNEVDISKMSSRELVNYYAKVKNNS